MEDGSQTAEIRAVMANLYMQREFVHGLPIKVADGLYSEIVNTIYQDGVKNEDKLNRIAIMLHNLRVRAANQLNTDNLLGLAAIYFYMDGEDPLDYSGANDMNRIAKMKSGTAEDVFFFAQKACEYTPQLKIILDTDLADYMKSADQLIKSQQMI